MTPKEKQTILVVDDSEINNDFLVEMLSNEYRVRVATDGESALDSVKHSLPDMILLDVLMPGLNGFEVCRLLKTNKDTQYIPVIFITTLTKDMDVLLGLELGAADYITRPFNPLIAKIRIKNHLKIKMHRTQLESQLQQAQKMDAIRLFAGGSASDLNNTLDAFISNPSKFDLVISDKGTPNITGVSWRKVQDWHF